MPGRASLPARLRHAALRWRPFRRASFLLPVQFGADRRYGQLPVVRNGDAAAHNATYGLHLADLRQAGQGQAARHGARSRRFRL
jgi:hypothetical protein